MLHGRVLRPPSYRAALEAFDGRRVEAMPGVRAVVRHGRFLGVVAEREEQAVAAAAALAKCATLEGAGGPARRRCPAGLPAVAAGEADGTEREGPALQARCADSARHLFAAVPGACLDRTVLRGRALPGGAIEVWSQSQSIHPTRKDIATTLGIEPGAITVHHDAGRRLLRPQRRR